MRSRFGGSSGEVTRWMSDTTVHSLQGHGALGSKSVALTASDGLETAQTTVTYNGRVWTATATTNAARRSFAPSIRRHLPTRSTCIRDPSNAKCQTIGKHVWKASFSYLALDACDVVLHATNARDLQLRIDESVGRAWIFVARLPDTSNVHQHSIKPANRILQIGDASHALPVIVKKLKTDVLVMGAVSRSRIERSFIGNTAEKVIDHVDCDVLVVKPANFKTSVTRTRAKL